MQDAKASHYDTLGVAHDATPEQIKAAYRRKASAFHPDRGEPSEKEDRQQAMAAVNAAHDVLSDPERRARYDATGSGDEPVDVIQQSAVVDLSRLFSESLEMESDPIKLVRAAIVTGRKQGEGVIANLKSKVLKLTKRRELVATKNGRENLMHAVIDRQINDANYRIEVNERAMKVADAIEKMLDDYEYLGVTAPPGGFDSRDSSDAFGYLLVGALGRRNL